MKQLTDEVRDAMRMAFNLGQTYWRQADSESIKQQNKSDATREQFKALMEETVATLSAATIESKQVPDLWMNLYTVAHNLLVFIGREGSVHTESSAVNSLSNAMHDIDGGTLLDEHALAAAQLKQAVRDALNLAADTCESTLYVEGDGTVSVYGPKTDANVEIRKCRDAIRALIKEI